MAYLILNNDGFLYKIAANDTDKNNLNCDLSIHTTIDISNDDFLKIKQELVDINISDDYLIFLTLSLLMFSLIFGLFASFVGIRKALND